MSRSIDNSESVMDSRDIRQAAEELVAEREDLETVLGDAKEALNSAEADESDSPEVERLKEAVDEAQKALDEFDGDTDKTSLIAFNEEGNDLTSEWHHGEAVIQRDHFVDYCKELVSEIGDMPNEIPSYIEIDWQKTADNLEADYSTLDFGGVEYLVRNC